jgi:LysR family pca operon transcriptional activator
MLFLTYLSEIFTTSLDHLVKPPRNNAGMGTRISVGLRHFRVLLEIVRQGSLTKAAQALSITQSAISKALRELESELGVTLIERGQKGVRLTQIGEDFYKSAAQCLASFSKTIDVAKSSIRHREVLRIGSLPTSSSSILPRAIHQFCAERNEITVQIFTGVYEYQISQMRTGALEMFVGPLINRDTMGLSFEKLYDEEVVLVCRPGHPLAIAQEFTLERISEFEILIPPVNTVIRDKVNDFFLAAGIRLPTPKIESLCMVFNRAYALEHDALWFAPRGTVTPDIKYQFLTLLPFNDPLWTAPIGITTQTTQPLSDAGLAFIEILRQLSATH